MIDTASIVIAVISMTGALLAALFTGYTTLLQDERKRRHEIRAEVRKYSDPLLVSAHDLQDRFREILDTDITHHDLSNYNGKQNLELFTCFLIAQYLAWTQILKNGTQFLAFSEDKSTSTLRQIIYKINDEFATTRYGRNGWEFKLWPGHQLAIGELMVGTRDGESQLRPIGWQQFKTEFDEKFAAYFRYTKESVQNVLKAKRDNPQAVPDQRLRRLQHLLIDLIKSLDPTGQVRSDREPKKCVPPQECDCLQCNNVELAKKRLDRTRTNRTKAPTPEKLDV